jgi:hypothetical protein
MHQGQQAAPARVHGDSAASPAPELPAIPELAAIPPGPAPRSVAGPPGGTVRTAAIEPETPRAAREFTRETLRRWDLCAVYPDAAVVVSELVTNALRYGLLPGHTPARAALGPVALTLWSRDGHLICAVADPNPEPPVLRPPDATAGSGRGLQVVQSLASNWGWTRRSGPQKVVWAALEVPRVRQPAVAHPAGSGTACLSSPGGKAGERPAGCAATGRKPAAQPAGRSRGERRRGRCPTRVGWPGQPRE